MASHSRSRPFSLTHLAWAIGLAWSAVPGAAWPAGGQGGGGGGNGGAACMTPALGCAPGDGMAGGNAASGPAAGGAGGAAGARVEQWAADTDVVYGGDGTEGDATGVSPGGGGGAGGYGLVLTRDGGSSLIRLDDFIMGGAGGNGGIDGGGGGEGGGGVMLLGRGGRLDSTGEIMGGMGGHGGFNPDSGGGGDGGTGVWLSADSVLINRAPIWGGIGGQGTVAGRGGAGVVMSAGSTVINTSEFASCCGATIMGGEEAVSGEGKVGDGIVAAAGGSIANYGGIIAAGFGDDADAAGIRGRDLRIVNGISEPAPGITMGGLIMGAVGASSDVVSRAIHFTGGVNELELRMDSVIMGAVDATASQHSTLVLGGDTELLGGNPFDASSIVTTLGSDPGANVFAGFHALEKRGSSDWELIGASTQLAPWTLREGTLWISQTDSLGAETAPLVFEGGTLGLRSGGATTLGSRPVQWGDRGGAFLVEDAGQVFEVGQSLESASAGSALIKEGPGTLRLSGQNRYAGPTAVAEGVLQAGSASGLPQGGAYFVDRHATLDLAGHDLRIGRLLSVCPFTCPDAPPASPGRQSGEIALGGAQLTLDTPADGFGAQYYDGEITGSGSVVKRGAGWLTLAGQQSYTGPTRVAEGGLTLAGRLASAQVSVAGGHLQLSGRADGHIDVGPAGRLSGQGSAGGLTVSAGGRLTPGDGVPGGVLRVDSDATFLPGSTYEVRLGADGVADRLVAGGTASLAGELRVVGDTASMQPHVTYSILQADKVSGRFDQVSTGATRYAFLRPVALYGEREVGLRLQRDPARLWFRDAARTGNQRGAADGLESLGPAHALYQYVERLAEGQPPQVFDALSGEVHASVSQALAGLAGAQGLRSSRALRSQLLAGRAPGQPVAQSQSGAWPLPAGALPTDRALPLWVEVQAVRQRSQGDGNAADSRWRDYGVSLGGAWPVGGGWRLGGSLGYTDGRLEVSDRRSRADVASVGAVLAAGRVVPTASGQLTVLVGAGYDWHRVRSRRDTRDSGLAQQLTARYRGESLNLFGELGHVWQLGPQWQLEPYVRLAWQQLRLDGFQESGGTAALHGRAQRLQGLETTLGLRGQWRFQVGETEGEVLAQLGWRHRHGGRQAGAELAFAGGQAFGVQARPLARDAVLAGLGLSWRLSPRAALSLDYEGEFARGERRHGARLALGWRF